MSKLLLQFGNTRMEVEGSDDLVTREREAFRAWLDALSHRVEEKKNAPAAEADRPKAEIRETVSTDSLCRMRQVHSGHIYPLLLKRRKEEGRLDEIINVGTEIDIPLTCGGTVTVVCGHVEPAFARFVFKDCWDVCEMNDEPTNKTGYYKSKGRRHVLEEIYPLIAPEWKEIIAPRAMTETIDGEQVKYADPMWLPSATDVFGTPENAWWKDESDDFQLPIFQRERDRVKECGDNGTYCWWLRSVNASSAYGFCYVYTSGEAGSSSAYYSYGFAPGFDI